MDSGNVNDLKQYLGELTKQSWGSQHQQQQQEEDNEEEGGGLLMIQYKEDEEGCFVNDQRSIELIEKPLTISQLVLLFQQSDCFVLPTHGEGWGLPIVEAMSMQLPVIGLSLLLLNRILQRSDQKNQTSSHPIKPPTGVEALSF